MELMDAAGWPMEDFLPSDPFGGNDLCHIVNFGGRQDVSSIAGNPLTLRFRLRNAQLYRFAFRD